MAIIIKDIEVPSCCSECEFKYYLHGEGQTYCKFTDKRIDYLESKNDTCPIISVNDIIEEMDEMRSKDKIAEYPYIRCMDALRRLP